MSLISSFSHFHHSWLDKRNPVQFKSSLAHNSVRNSKTLEKASEKRKNLECWRDRLAFEEKQKKKKNTKKNFMLHMTNTMYTCIHVYCMFLC